MATAIAAPEVTQAVIDRIVAVLGNPPVVGGFVVKTFQAGALRLQPARPDLGLDLPMLLAYPQTAYSISVRDIGTTAYTVEHQIRLLYLREFSQGSGVEKGFWDEVDRLAQVFLDETMAGEPTIASVQLERVVAESLDYYPPEVGLLAERGRADILVGAVTVRVRAWTQRVP